MAPMHTYRFAGFTGLLLTGLLSTPLRTQAPPAAPATAPTAPKALARRTTLPEYPVQTDHIGSGFGGTLSFDDHAEDDSVQSFVGHYLQHSHQGGNWSGCGEVDGVSLLLQSTQRNANDRF